VEPGNNGNAIQKATEEGKGEAILSLLVSYNGEPFAGFARQPGQLTVQGSIEEALGLVFRRPIETVCAGRTDSGVHARGQVVSFSLSEEELACRSEFKLLRSLNALTHEDISVKSVRRQASDFSARFSCTMREYKYFICTDAYKPLLMKGFCWHIPKELDLEAMRAAAAYLIGEHDFKSFCMAASAEGKSTMRNVFSIEVSREDAWGENLVVITVKGNAFLHSMVRTIVGTLVAVGLGRRRPESRGGGRKRASAGLGVLER
jgi:tRNA pseudouridine38-40 synthase